MVKDYANWEAAIVDDEDATMDEVRAGMGSSSTLEDREIWPMERESSDPRIFYNDFPPLPDFPCMSSSSSSSSTPAVATRPVASSSSSTSSSSCTSASAASWALLKSEAEEDPPSGSRPPAAAADGNDNNRVMQQQQQPEHEIDCMDVMESFEYMDLMDSSYIWDTSSLFDNIDDQQPPQQQQQTPPGNDSVQAQSQQDPMQPQQYNQQQQHQEEGNSGGGAHRERPAAAFDELGAVFFEWLKSNKNYISADDMRSIKLRRTTVECASKRLGATQEGRKQLLKLILEWVEQYQLHKKRLREEQAAAAAFQQFQNPNPNLNNINNPLPPQDPNPSPYFSPQTWTPPPPPPSAYVNPVNIVPPPPQPSAYPAYVDPYSHGGGVTVPSMNPYVNGPIYPSPPPYHMLDTSQTWPQSQFVMASSQFGSYPDGGNGFSPQGFPPQAYGNVNNQYQYSYYNQVGNGNGNGNGDKFVSMGASATKEARKKRMARQRKLFSHHRHQNHHNNAHQQNQHHHHVQITDDQDAHIALENCGNASQSNSANWVYWPCASPSPSGMNIPPPVEEQHHQQQQAMERPPVPVAQNYQQRQASASSEKQQQRQVNK